MTPEELQQRVLYRDGLMLVVDKPAGLPVHAGPKGGKVLEHWFPQLQYGLPKPPALAHRLDRDTSGCLILGRHAKALRRLGKLFMDGRIAKTYWAVAEGVPAGESGTVDLALAKRSTEQRGWWMTGHPEGQTAVTDWRLRGTADGLSFIEFFPRTGRTHQIRVHAAEGLGCPLLGDPVYGREGRAATVPLHLHARALSIPLYPSREAIAVTAPVPPHMQQRLAALGWSAAEDADLNPASVREPAAPAP